jgi:hypothetical protein
MSKVFRPWDVDEVWLFPASVQGFVPPGHIAHLIRHARSPVQAGKRDRQIGVGGLRRNRLLGQTGRVFAASGPLVKFGGHPVVEAVVRVVLGEITRQREACSQIVEFSDDPEQFAFERGVTGIAVDGGLQDRACFGRFLCRLQQIDITGQCRQGIGDDLEGALVSGNSAVHIAGRDLNPGLHIQDIDISRKLVSQFGRRRGGILPIPTQSVQID